MNENLKIFEKIEQTSVDVMSNFYDKLGGKPIVGRILGLLLVQDKPISLKKISSKLEISKPAASINIKHLDDIGMVRKVFVPEFPRENFYEVTFDSVEMLYDSVLKKINMMKSSFSNILKCFSEKTVGNLEKQRLNYVRKRIKKLDDSLSIYLDEYKELNDRMKIRINGLK